MVLALAACRGAPGSWEARHGGAIPLRVVNDSDYRVIEVHVAEPGAPASAATLALGELAPRSDAWLRIRPGTYHVWIRVAVEHDGVDREAEPRCEEYGACLGADAPRVAMVDATGIAIVFFRPAPGGPPTGRSERTWRIPLLPRSPADRVDPDDPRSAAPPSAPGSGRRPAAAVSDALAAMGVRGAADCRAVIRRSVADCASPDCRAFVSGNPTLCRSADCRAVTGGHPSLCRTLDCRGVAGRNRAACSSGDCRGLTTGDALLCDSGNCRAIVSSNDALCE